MKKFNITRKEIVGKLFIAIPFILFACLTYIASIHGPEGDGSFELTWDMIFDPVVFAIALIVILIVGLFAYIVNRKYLFYDSGEFITLEKGWFFKKETKLLYTNINTIAIKRSLLDLILKTSKVEVDTGTTANPLAELKFHLNRDYAIYLKNFLEAKKTTKDLELLGPKEFEGVETTEVNYLYKVKNSHLLQMGLFKPGFLASALSFFFISFISAFLIYLSSDNSAETITIGNAIGSIMLGYVGVLVFLIIGFSMGHFLKYYNYRLIDHGDTLEYEYGLLSRTNFKFKKSKINALYVKRSLLYRLFNKYSIEASIIGIGELSQDTNENTQGNESRFLLPYGNKEELDHILKNIKGEAILDNELDKPERLTKVNFIIIPLIMPTILLVTLIVLTITINNGLLILLSGYLLLYAFLIIACILRLKYHGVKIDRAILIRQGAFTVTKVLISKDKIQTVNFNNGPINQLLKVGNLTFRYKRLLGIINIKGYTFEKYLQLANKTFNK